MLLWKKYLKDPSLSLVEFIRYLNEVIDEERDKESSNDFMQNLLKVIRITFNYVLENKAKLPKRASRLNCNMNFRRRSADCRKFRN